MLEMEMKIGRSRLDIYAVDMDGILTSLQTDIMMMQSAVKVGLSPCPDLQDQDMD